MLAYREIVEKKDDIVKVTNLLNRLKNQKIEVIIVPLAKEKTVSFKSLKGALSKYSNLDMIKLEGSAWEKAIEDKYGNSWCKCNS